MVFLVLGYLVLAVLVAMEATKDTKAKADAIIVLGARAYVGGEYNPCLEARIDQAVALYNADYAGKIIVTGGTDKEDNTNEAETMKKMAVKKGVPASAILKENAATSTYENFRLSADVMRKNELKSVIVVTEPFHAVRASLVAKKLGYTFTQSPAQESPCWTKHTYFSRYFLKEPIAILVYKLQGKL